MGVCFACCGPLIPTQTARKRCKTPFSHATGMEANLLRIPRGYTCSILRHSVYSSRARRALPLFAAAYTGAQKQRGSTRSSNGNSNEHQFYLMWPPHPSEKDDVSPWIAWLKSTYLVPGVHVSPPQDRACTPLTACCRVPHVKRLPAMGDA